jgi:hypothetical protein
MTEACRRPSVRRTWTTAAAAALAVLIPGVAGGISAAPAAAADWTAPEQLAGTSTWVSAPLVTAAPDGAVTALSATNATLGNGDSTADVVGQRSTGGAFGAAAELGDTGDSGSPPPTVGTQGDAALFGNAQFSTLAAGAYGDAAAIWRRCDFNSATRVDTCSEEAAYRAPGTDTWTDLGTLPSSDYTTSVAAGVDAAGNATFVWVDGPGSSGFTLYEADAAAGAGAIGAAHVLYRDTASSAATHTFMQMAEAPSGDATVLLLDQNQTATTEEAIRRSAGTWDSGTPILQWGSAPAGGSLASLQLDSTGRAHALFVGYPPSPVGGSNLFSVSQSADGAWAAPETVPGTAGAGSGALVSDDAGNLTAVFSGRGTSYPYAPFIDTATHPTGGSWGSPQQLSADPNINVVSAAGDGAGDLVVAWGDSVTDASTGHPDVSIHAILERAGAAPGPDETLRTIMNSSAPNQPLALSMDSHGVATLAYGTDTLDLSTASSIYNPVEVVRSTVALAPAPLSLAASGSGTQKVVLSGGGADPGSPVTLTLTRDSDGQTFPITTTADSSGGFSVEVDEGPTFTGGAYTASAAQGSHKSPAVHFTLTAPTYTLQGGDPTGPKPDISVDTDGLSAGYGQWLPSSTGSDPVLSGSDSAIEVTWSCAPAAGGAPIKSCTLGVTGKPDWGSWDPSSHLASQHQLATGTDVPGYTAACGAACRYTLTGTVVDTAGLTRTRTFDFTVVPAGGLSTALSDLTGQSNSLVSGIRNGLTSGSLVSYQAITERYPDGSVHTVAWAGSDGTIAVGSLISDNSSSIIAAGAYNLVPLSGGGFAIIAGGVRVGAIINAGSGNIEVLGHDGRIIAAGSGNLISDNSSSIIAAGSGNLISDNSSSIIAAGSGNIINAGAHNLTATGAGALGGGAAALPAQELTGAAGSLLSVTLTTAAGSTTASAAAARGSVGATAARSKHGKRAVTLGRGAVGFSAAHARRALVLVFGKRGAVLISALQRSNDNRRRHHKPLRRIRLTLVMRVRTATGATATRQRTFTVAPVSRRRR